MKKPELLAPAGNFEKLKMAVRYGADAVYFAGKKFGLRAASDNFDLIEMERAVEYLHARGKKAHLTVNIIPHNEDLLGLPEYIKDVVSIGVDAIIVADPGVFSIIKEVSEDIDVHISTQANNTNYKSVEFWHKLGAKRIVLARELSLKEIKEIKENISKEIELEAFIHGAMCISYSGRCLLSNYMIQRDANRGECAHPCRWKYYLTEEKRPGEYMQVFEDDNGTHIFNSKDLCMIEHIPELIDAGIESFKIEGRVKSVYYVATVIKAYRQAIDEYVKNHYNYKFDNILLDELKKVSHRPYSTGFYFNKPDEKGQIYDNSSYIREYGVIGIVKEYDSVNKIAVIEQRNRFYKGDIIEFLPIKGEYISLVVKEMKNELDEDIDVAPHPQMTVKIPVDFSLEPNTIIRKKK